MTALEHGRSAWLHGRCRCSRCRRELLEYARLRRAVQTVKRGGAPATRVRSGPARRHVARLRVEGWTIARIAAAAGVSPVTVWRITARSHVSRITAVAVLALEP